MQGPFKKLCFDRDVIIITKIYKYKIYKLYIDDDDENGLLYQINFSMEFSSKSNK